MFKLIIVTLAFFTSYMHAISFQCFRLDSGASVKTRFDSLGPKLDEASLKLLSATGACGQQFDFSSRCNTNLIHQGEEYNFGFRCDDVYGDLYFTALNGGAAQFRCFGEGVPESYNSRIYRQCTVSP